MKTSTVALAVCVMAFPFTACNESSATDDGKPTVAVAFYPIEEIVRRIGGADIDIINLVPPGEEAHEFEPTARQVTHLENADMVFYLGSGFQPNLEKAIDSLPRSVRRVDLMGDLTLLPNDHGFDPHVWLDPGEMQLMAQTVADVLGEEIPSRAAAFASSAATYVRDLAELDDEFATGLADCAVPVLVTTHEAFAYLAKAYGLTQVAIAGLSPGDEPSAKWLETIADIASNAGVTTIFFEGNLPPALAETVAREIGADTAALATAESPTQSQLDAGESYLSLMRDNLHVLRAGMGCT